MEGMDIVKKIELLGTADGKPSGFVKIVDCGEMSETKMQNAVGAEKGIVYNCRALSMCACTHAHRT